MHREDEMHLNPAPQSGGADGVSKRFVRHEIRRCDHNSFPCRVQHRDDEFPPVFMKIPRSAWNQLAWRCPGVNQFWEHVLAIEYISGLEVMVRKKHCPKLSNGRTGQPRH